jgi:hypothetical protein
MTHEKHEIAVFIENEEMLREVEIVMKNSRTGKIIKSESDLEWDEDGVCDRAVPKLNSEGCLILKKK